MSGKRAKRPAMHLAPSSPEPVPPAGAPSAPAAGPARPRIGLAVCSLLPPEQSPAIQMFLLRAEKGARLAGGAVARSVWPLWPGDGGWERGFARREVLAADLACFAQAEGLDGLILAAGGNDAAAGFALGAARLNLPSLVLPLPEEPAGPPAADGGASFYARSFAAVLSEAMGWALPGASTVPAAAWEAAGLAEKTGRRAVELVGESLDARRALPAAAFFNAVRLDAALGGLTDAALFLFSLGREAGVRLTVDDAARLGKETPQIHRPVGRDAFREAGGVPAFIRALKGAWQSHPTAAGWDSDGLLRAAPPSSKLLRTKPPYRKAGGLAVLKGNLASEGAVLRWPDRPLRQPLYAGPARVCDSLEQALAAVRERKVRPGDVLVVRFEGPRAGRGFRPLAALAGLLAARGLDASVPVVTDGRAGPPAPSGCFIELVSPEAADGSTLALLRDGDRVEADPAAGRLTAHLTDLDLRMRAARWRPPSGVPFSAPRRPAPSPLFSPGRP